MMLESYCLTSYDSRVRDSICSSCQSSREKTVFLASRTWADNGVFSPPEAGASKADMPVTFPSLSMVTTSRCDCPPSMPRSSSTEPSVARRMGARLYFLNSAEAAGQNYYQQCVSINHTGCRASYLR